LYKAELVPVGEDQKQHIEFARELARRFNKKFGQTFPEVKIKIPEFGAKIMDLKDPHKKNVKKHDLMGCLFSF
jgi:tryptophanyl-tRNA synthetase